MQTRHDSLHYSFQRPEAGYPFASLSACTVADANDLQNEGAGTAPGGLDGPSSVGVTNTLCPRASDLFSHGFFSLPFSMFFFFSLSPLSSLSLHLRLFSFICLIPHCGTLFLSRSPSPILSFTLTTPHSLSVCLLLSQTLLRK